MSVMDSATTRTAVINNPFWYPKVFAPVCSLAILSFSLLDTQLFIRPHRREQTVFVLDGWSIQNTLIWMRTQLIQGVTQTLGNARVANIIRFLENPGTQPFEEPLLLQILRDQDGTRWRQVGERDQVVRGPVNELHEREHAPQREDRADLAGR